MAVLKTRWPAAPAEPKKEVIVEEKKVEEKEELIVEPSLEDPTADEFIASLPKKPKNKKYKIVN